MSYFDDASLVMIPSGYKDQKVYSVKPLDGSGDLTFSRASSATRVASNGLIEKVRTNLALYSEEFSNAYWTKTTVTITDNTAANPINGATTADTLTRTGGGSGFLRRQIAQTGIVAFSVFAKSGSTNLVRLNIFDGSTDRGATYNLTTGAITSVYGSPLFTLAQDFGSGWYRISISVNAASYSDCQIHLDSVNSVIIFGAQLETGDIATDYIATTSAAVSVGPVSGLPRLDYLNSTCPRLLLEPQRTNLAIYSEQLTNAEYTADNASFTANAGASPDGYTNADLLTENSSSAAHGFYASVATRGTTGASLTTSIFAKSNGRRYINISGGFDSGNYYNAVFDLQNGVVSTTGNAGAGTSPVASIVSYGNGWYRCIVTGSVTGLNNRLSFVYLSNSATGNGVGGATYTGNGTSGAYFYGYQIEAGAYATSYIPTLGTSVTRVREVTQKSSISSLIGQTEGVLFAEFSYNGVANNGIYEVIISVNDGTSNNRIDLVKNNTTAELYVFAINGGVIQVNSVGIAGTNLLGTHKVALAYKLNDYVCYLDGVQIYSDTTATVPAVGILDIGTDSTNTITGTISQALLFKTRLTNAQLAELTTL